MVGSVSSAAATLATVDAATTYALNTMRIQSTPTIFVNGVSVDWGNTVRDAAGLGQAIEAAAADEPPVTVLVSVRPVGLEAEVTLPIRALARRSPASTWKAVEEEVKPWKYPQRLPASCQWRSWKS